VSAASTPRDTAKARISFLSIRTCAKSGGRIHKKKFSIGQYGFISLAIDTEGNMFGLHSMK